MTSVQYFCRRWSEALWTRMSETGKGYKRHSLRNSGKGTDRRKDKLDENGREIYSRYSQLRLEGKLERKFRLARVG